MPKKTITIPIQQQYPFESIHLSDTSNHKIQAIQTIQLPISPHPQIPQKIKTIKTLTHHSFINLQSITQNKNLIHLTYQYIPFQYQNQLNTLDELYINQIQEDMYKLTRILADLYILHDVSSKNMGVSCQNRLKYYLGFNFQIDRSIKKEQYLQRYDRMVQNIFRGRGESRKVKSPTKLCKKEYYDTMDTVNTQQRFRKTHETEEIRTNNYLNLEDLGARINKLINYVKDVTGKTPKGSIGLSKFTVNIDQNNTNNRIFQQNKILITPSFTHLQNKIAEFKQRKLFRTQNQKQILYQNHHLNNHPTHKIMSNCQSKRDNRIITTLGSAGNINNNNNYFNSVFEPNKKINRFIMNNQNLKLDNKLKIKFQSKQHAQIPAYILKNYQSNQNNNRQDNQNRSQELQVALNKREYPTIEKQYLQLAKNDKYCQQFFCILDDSQVQKQQKKIKQQIKRHNMKYNRHQVKSQVRNDEIESRVKNVIKNSINLMNRLKTKESINNH